MRDINPFLGAKCRLGEGTVRVENWSRFYHFTGEIMLVIFIRGFEDIQEGVFCWWEVINALHFQKTNSSVQEGQGHTESRGEPWEWLKIQLQVALTTLLGLDLMVTAGTFQSQSHSKRWDIEQLKRWTVTRMKNLLNWDLVPPKNISEVHGLHPQFLWVSISFPCCLPLILVLPRREGNIYLQPDKGD